jgi:hypothetical protein
MALVLDVEMMFDVETAFDDVEIVLETVLEDVVEVVVWPIG